MIQSVAGRWRTAEDLTSWFHNVTQSFHFRWRVIQQTSALFHKGIDVEHQLHPNFIVVTDSGGSRCRSIFPQSFQTFLSFLN